MAIAAVNPGPSRGAWPMTAEAHARLQADADELARKVLEQNGYVTGHLDGEVDAPSFVPNIAGQQARRRLEAARAVLERAEVVDDPDVAVIGRTVSLREADGAISRYTLVIPGDGSAGAGRVSADSPVGSAIVGRVVGETVTVVAPAGAWIAVIEAIG